MSVIVEWIQEYATTVIFLGIVVCIMIYTIKSMIKSKGSCNCGSPTCPKSDSYSQHACKKDAAPQSKT